jgi:hypothetical protein
MADLPEDPHGEGYVVEDECAAVGMAVMDVFCGGADFVIVRKVQGCFNIFGFGTDDEPTALIEALPPTDEYDDMEDGYFDDDDDYSDLDFEDED